MNVHAAQEQKQATVHAVVRYLQMLMAASAPAMLTSAIRCSPTAVIQPIEEIQRSAVNKR